MLSPLSFWFLASKLVFSQNSSKNSPEVSSPSNTQTFIIKFLMQPRMLFWQSKHDFDINTSRFCIAMMSCCSKQVYDLTCWIQMQSPIACSCSTNKVPAYFNILDICTTFWWDMNTVFPCCCIARNDMLWMHDI